MLFTYKAIDNTGTIVTGTYSTTDQSHVVAYIKAQRMTPIEVSAGRATTLSSLLPKKRPKAKDLGMFCEQFCALLRAGVTVMDALKLLTGQTKSKTLTEAIQVAANGINDGESLTNSMAKSPNAFDDTLVSLIHAGEESGSLDISLERMSSQYKKDAAIKAAIQKAAAYPIFVLVVAIAVVIFMLVWIVPSYMSIFAEVGMEMPKITLAVVAASEWFMANYLLVLALLIAIVFAFMLFRKSTQGKRFFSKLALTMPGVKQFVIKSTASKIARTLSTLLTSGMTVTESLAILETTVTNVYYQEAIKEIREDVMVGQPMSKKFVEHPELFPQMLSHMIAVGEDTGDISIMLERTAEYYDLEVDTATQTMMSMMQPMIIIMLTAIVGVIVAAVLAPMVKMYSELGGAL